MKCDCGDTYIEVIEEYRHTTRLGTIVVPKQKLMRCPTCGPGDNDALDIADCDEIDAQFKILRDTCKTFVQPTEPPMKRCYMCGRKQEEHEQTNHQRT